MTLFQCHNALKHPEGTEKCMILTFSFRHQLQNVRTVHIVLAHALCQHVNLFYLFCRLDLKFLPEHIPKSLIRLHRALRMPHGDQRLHLVHDKSICTEVHRRSLFADVDHLCPALLFLQKWKDHLTDVQIQRLVIPPQGDCSVTVVAGEEIPFVQLYRT